MRRLRDVRNWLDRFEYRLQYILWLVSIPVLGVAGGALWYFFARTATGLPWQDVVFILGVTVGTSGAANDWWASYFKERSARHAQKYSALATAMTWAGLAMACGSAATSGFEALPLWFSIAFFTGMTVVSIIAWRVLYWAHVLEKPAKLNTTIKGA